MKSKFEEENEAKFQSEDTKSANTSASGTETLLQGEDVLGKIKGVQVRSQTHQPLLVQCTCDKDGTLRVDIMDTATPDKEASVVALSTGFKGIPVKQIDTY